MGRWTPVSERFAVRRFIDLSDTEGGQSFHQFIGIVSEPDDCSAFLRKRAETSGGSSRTPEWVGNDPEDRVRAIIEKAYEESTLDGVRTHDVHKVARIDKECSVGSEVLSSAKNEEAVGVREETNATPTEPEVLQGSPTKEETE